MSGVNAQIPLAFNPAPIGPSFGKAVGDAQQLMALQQNQQQVQRANQLRSILGTPDALDPTGQPKPDTLSKVMSVDPEAGMKLQQNALATQQRQLQMDQFKTKTFAQQFEMTKDVSDEAYTAYKQAIADGLSEPAARQRGQAIQSEGLERLGKSGMFSDQQQQTWPRQFDPVHAAAHVQSYDQWQKRRDDEEKIKRGERHDEAMQDRAGAGTLVDSNGRPYIVRPNAPPGKNAFYLDGTSVDDAAIVGSHKMGTATAPKPPVELSVTDDAGKTTHTEGVWDGKAWHDLSGNPIRGNVAQVPKSAPGDDKPMSDEGIAYAGTMYRDKGVLPSFGNSRYAVQDRKRIIDWAANRDNKSADAAGGDIVTQAGVKADTGSLAQTTRYRNQVESFEETAQQSAKLIRSLAPKGLGPTGVPVIDSWMQAGRKAVGNADVVKFGNAIDTFTSEYAKIMSGATGAAGSTDSARAKAEGLINKAQNADQLYGALDVMQQEMNIRRKSLIDQEAQIRDELGAVGGRKEAEPGRASQQQLPTITRDEVGRVAYDKLPMHSQYLDQGVPHWKGGPPPGGAPTQSTPAAAPSTAAPGNSEQPTSLAPPKFVEGKTYVDSKGNRAVYRNGKFEPAQ